MYRKVLCLFDPWFLPQEQRGIFLLFPYKSVWILWSRLKKNNLVKLFHNSRHLGMCSVDFICFSLDFISVIFFLCEFFCCCCLFLQGTGGVISARILLELVFLSFPSLTCTHIADHFNKIQGLQGTAFRIYGSCQYWVLDKSILFARFWEIQVHCAMVSMGYTFPCIPFSHFWQCTAMITAKDFCAVPCW